MAGMLFTVAGLGEFVAIDLCAVEPEVAHRIASQEAEVRECCHHHDGDELSDVHGLSVNSHLVLIQT